MRRLIVMLGFALVTAIVAFFIYTTLSGEDTEAPTAPSGGVSAPAIDGPFFLQADDAAVIASHRLNEASHSRSAEPALEPRRSLHPDLVARATR
jgi:hypothetical protein